MKVCRTAIVALSAAALFATAGASTAGATPIGYIEQLGAHGLSVYDIKQALTVGYGVCQALDVANGADVARALVGLGRADGWTLAQTQIIVRVAVEQLCPWHDHRAIVLR